MFTLTTRSVILFIAFAINFIVAFMSWQRSRTRDGLYFAIAMSGVAFWTLAAMFDSATISTSLKVFFVKLDYTGYTIALVFFALFVLFYAGYENWLEKTWIKALSIFIPLSNILLVWTNDWHQWLWSGLVKNAVSGSTVVFERGPASIFAVITGYLVIFSIILPLWGATRRGSELARRQARLLFMASLIMVLGNLLYLFGPPDLRELDWRQIALSISGLLFFLALYGTRLLDFVPLARHRLVSSLSDGMIVFDMQNRIVDINLAAAQIVGSHAESLIGKDMHEIVLLSKSFSDYPLDQEIKTELEIGSTNRHYFDVLLSPLRNGRNKLIGRLMVFRNITERKKNELRLLQLTQAVEQSPASVLVTDLEGDITYVNPHFTILTGYSLSEVIGKNTNIVRSGHTPDHVYQDMWNTIKGGRTWQGEFLNRKKNGDLYWENAVIAPVVDSEGQILNFIAIKEDITKRKDAESALRSSEERFRHLVMSAPDAVFGVDQSGKIILANREAASLLGYEDEELIGFSVENLVPEILRDWHIDHRAHYLEHPSTRVMGKALELSARRKDGKVVPVEINLSHSLTEKGPMVIAHMRDITQRRLADDALRDANQQLEKQLREIEMLQASLREQALHDPLTQLHNRRFLDEAIEQALHHAERASEALSIILLDIDHFKAINDEFGHAAGDACLVALANILQRNLRKADISCRYGGEEFLLVLPTTNLEGAVLYAEKLRLLVNNEVFIPEQKEIKFTISIGIASYPSHGATQSEIINKADDAMYVSKRRGRNCITVWSPKD